MFSKKETKNKKVTDTKKVKKAKASKDTKNKNLVIVDHTENNINKIIDEKPKPQPLPQRKLSQDQALKPEKSLKEFNLPKINDFLSSGKLNKRDIIQTKEEIGAMFSNR